MVMLQTEATKLIRKALKAEFPEVKFSVRCGKGSSSFIHIHWQDGLEYGVTNQKVEIIAANAINNEWGIIASANYSPELIFEVEAMVSAFYKEEYNYRNDSHRDKKYQILNLNCHEILPIKKELAPTPEPVNVIEGLEGATTTEPEDGQPIYAIRFAEGRNDKPYAKGGYTSEFIYFDSLINLEKAINLHAQGMAKDKQGYNKHDVIVTLPNNETHCIRVDLLESQEIDLKQETLNNLIANKKFLESINENGEKLGQIENYSKKIQVAIKWVNQKEEPKKETQKQPEPVQPKTLPTTVTEVAKTLNKDDLDTSNNNKLINLLNLYEAWVKRLIDEKNLARIRSFDEWQESVSSWL